MMQQQLCNLSIVVALAVLPLACSTEVGGIGAAELDRAEDFRLMVSRDAVTMNVGETAQVVAQVSSAANSEVAIGLVLLQWRSADPDVVRVEEGVLTALAEGVTEVGVRAVLVDQALTLEGRISLVVHDGRATDPGVDPDPSRCLAASAAGAYVGQALANQTGTFEAVFHVTPASAALNGAVVLPGAAGSDLYWTDFAAIVRFSGGVLDVRNGDAYDSAGEVAFVVGARHAVRMVVDVPRRLYSAHVQIDGGAERTLATDFAFRSEQQAASSIGQWGLRVESGDLDACLVSLTPVPGADGTPPSDATDPTDATPPSDTPPPPPPTSPGTGTVLYEGVMHTARVAEFSDWCSIEPWLSDMRALGIPEIGTMCPSAYVASEKVLDGGSSVLRGEIIGSDPSDAARFQSSTYFPNRDLGIYHHTQRIKLGADIEHIRQYPGSIGPKSGDAWFTVFETWIGNSVVRQNLSISKESGVGAPLTWDLMNETGTFQTVWWAPPNTSVPVPIGKWFTMDVYIKSGEGTDGRLKITITVDGEEPVVLFDEHRTTIAPGQPQVYRRKTDHMKFYMGGALRDFMLDANKRLEVRFGDYRIYQD